MNEIACTTSNTKSSSILAKKINAIYVNNPNVEVHRSFMKWVITSFKTNDVKY